jgi:hypothetical protein
MLSSSVGTYLEEEPEVTAIGGKPVSGNTLNFSLYTGITEQDEFGPEWTGTGIFIIVLGITTEVATEKMFLYSQEQPDTWGTNVPKYYIKDTVSTIPFSDFIDVSALMQSD